MSYYDVCMDIPIGNPPVTAVGSLSPSSLEAVALTVIAVHSFNSNGISLECISVEYPVAFSSTGIV